MVSSQSQGFQFNLLEAQSDLAFHSFIPVSQRIWTPRGFGPPGPNPLADLDPPGPYLLADLDPLRGFGPPPTKHPFFPVYSNWKLLADVL